MKKSITERRHNGTRLVLGCALGLLAGCGDAYVFSVNPGPGVDSSTDGGIACLGGAEIELVRHSSSCGSATSKSLVAVIGDGIEFSAEQMRGLESPCDGPSPGVEVRLDDRSLIFDFSNVTKPGRFPKGDFEGYVIDVVLNEDSALLLAVSVDAEASSIGVENADVACSPSHIEVNFEDLSYDDSGFVKIDLWFASVVSGTQ
jgi:hypothetical protein